jgi:hypothetical protein
MEEYWEHCAKYNKPVSKDKHHMFSLIWATYYSQTYKESQTVFAKDLGQGIDNREILLNECRVSVLQDEKSFRDRWE